MNWFKKLFSNNEEEHIEEQEVEEISPREPRTPFRFPLISDSEKNEFLYGSKEEKEIIEPEPIKPEKKIYEAPPIYEGWQQRKLQPTTKRVEKVIVDEPIIEKKKRPFTPTQVPSPVYGYNKPKGNLRNSYQQEQVDKEEVTILTNKKVEPVVPILKEEKPEQLVTTTELYEPKGDVIVEPEVPVLDELTLKEEPTSTSIEVESYVPTPKEKEQAVEMVTTSDEILEKETDNIEEYAVSELEQQGKKEELEPMNNEIESYVPTLKEEQAVELIAATEVLEKEDAVEILDSSPSSVIEGPLEEVREQAVEVEDLKEQVLEDENQPQYMEVEKLQPQQEDVKVTETKSKEKIRPFNVLMLKSDKEKLNKLENKIIPLYQSPTSNRSVVEEKPMEAPTQEKVVIEETIAVNPPLEEEPQSTYEKPSFSYLLPPEIKDEDKEWMENQAFTLVEALSYFQVSGEIVQMVQGPAVTQFEITVGHGTKVSKIRNLADDLKLALAAKDIRIQAPIPGKRSIGIEIPNRKSRAVRISEVLNTDVFKESDSPLESALGLDLTGKPVTIDLRKMPHGLIAGATGSGKSVFINSLLVSLLYKATPNELKLLLIDPKMVELAPFNHIPHLVSPVITDVKAATAALKWAVEEMERRYQLFAHIGVRDISRYNTLATEKRQFAQKLPYLVIVIDELADLMMMAPTEVEDAICRIAQKARACGIHLVLATQRPSVDVITGLIKANIPTRIAFSVSSQIDSRTILDQQGAERLLGRGDMLYQGNGMSSPVRIQGTYVTDEEIESVIEFARSQGTPEYIFEQDELIQKSEVAAEQDDLFEEACRFVVEQGTASTSLLQRKFHLGYNRAARLIDAMHEAGFISEQRGSKAREVLLKNDTLDQIFS